MKYKLIAEPTQQLAYEQVLLNRGVQKDKLHFYTVPTSSCINEPEMFGADRLKLAATVLLTHIKNKNDTVIVVDPDVDGNTSSALLLNYLYDFFPSWVANNVDFIFHSGKQHGLNDVCDDIINGEYKLVLCPDAGSNDFESCKKLRENNIDIIILDHHDFNEKNEYANVIINNQNGYSDYPNKFLSGVGVVWQFCRYLDKLLNSNKADNYLDLVAIGLCGDMMSFLEPETFTLIQEGLKDIHNPFIYYLAEKNRFKLGEDITPIGAAFYIVPLLNAVQRSGTQEEKELVFD